MSLLKPLLEDLAKQRTFRFEEPWRLSSKALGLAVPIVRAEYGERAYLVLDEIPGGVDIRDSGEIRRLIAKSGVDKPVFIRGGVLVKGRHSPGPSASASSSSRARRGPSRPSASTT